MMWLTCELDCWGRGNLRAMLALTGRRFLRLRRAAPGIVEVLSVPAETLDLNSGPAADACAHVARTPRAHVYDGAGGARGWPFAGGAASPAKDIVAVRVATRVTAVTLGARSAAVAPYLPVGACGPSGPARAAVLA